MTDIALLQKEHKEKIAVQAQVARELNSMSLDAEKLTPALEAGQGIDAVMDGETLAKRESLITLWRAAKDDVMVASDQLEQARLEVEYDAIPTAIQAEAKNTMLGALEAFADDKLEADNPYAGAGGKVLEFPQPYIRKNAAGINEVTPYPVQFTRAGDMDHVKTERVANLLASGDILKMGPEHLQAAIGTTTTGLPGSVPLTLLGLFRQALHYNRIMARSTVKPVPYLKGTYKGTVRTGVNKAEIVTEATAIPDKDPVYSELEIVVHKYGAYVKLSYESDNTIQPWSLVGDLEDNLSEAMGVAMSEHHAVGDGSSKPLGVVPSANVAGNQFTAATGADLLTDYAATWKGLSQLWTKLKPTYRSAPGFSIMLASTPFATTSAMTDETTSNRPMFRWTEDPNVMPIIDGYLANRAVMEIPEMVYGAAGAFPIVVGDLARYLILMAGGLRVESSEHVAFLNDQIVIRALQSSGSKATIPEAFARVTTTAK